MNPIFQMGWFNHQLGITISLTFWHKFLQPPFSAEHLQWHHAGAEEEGNSRSGGRGPVATWERQELNGATIEKQMNG